MKIISWKNRRTKEARIRFSIGLCLTHSPTHLRSTLHILKTQPQLRFLTEPRLSNCRKENGQRGCSLKMFRKYYIIIIHRKYENGYIHEQYLTKYIRSTYIIVVNKTKRKGTIRMYLISFNSKALAKYLEFRNVENMFTTSTRYTYFFVWNLSIQVPVLILQGTILRYYGYHTIIRQKNGTRALHLHIEFTKATIFVEFVN